MANVWTELYCDKFESDFWVLRKKKLKLLGAWAALVLWPLS
jgi:hypothetical protein